MEFMPEFKSLKPTTVEQAVSMSSEFDDAMYLAGGSDLLVNVRRGIAKPKTMIHLSDITEINTVTQQSDGSVTIGAGVTLAAIQQNDTLAVEYPALVEAASVVAAATHRQVATLGGNLCLDTRCVYYNQSEWWRESNRFCLKNCGDICHVAPSGDDCFAAFSGDVAPAIIALGGVVEIANPEGRRTLPLEEMYNDNGLDHLKLSADDIVVSVTIPTPSNNHSTYQKARVRGAIDFPLAGVAVNISFAGKSIETLRVALTGVNSCPYLVQGTDEFIGSALDDVSIEKMVGLLPKQIQPMTSTFTPPGYRRKVVSNLLRAVLRRLNDKSD